MSNPGFDRCIKLCDEILEKLRQEPVMWEPVKFGISDFSTIEIQPDGTKSVRAGPVVKWAKVRDHSTGEEFKLEYPQGKARDKWLFGDWDTIAVNTRPATDWYSAVYGQQPEVCFTKKRSEEISDTVTSEDIQGWKAGKKETESPAEKKIDIMKAIRDMCR